MQGAWREDLLEAILALERSSNESPTVEQVASRAARTTAAIRTALKLLEQQKDLVILPGEIVALTPQGRSIALRVERKHQILQCFLSDVLGMDRRSASEEACILEHGVSDQTIDRLDDYLGGQPGPVVPKNSSNDKEIQKTVSLLDFNEGDLLRVCTVREDPGYTRLLDLGIVPEARILIRRKLRNTAVIVSVKGADIALSGEIARLVLVEKFG